MAIFKTKGIILKRTNLGEADRILTILTQDRGKIRVVAKGIRKTLSKLAGNCELFTAGNFMLAEGRNLDILTSAEMTECFPGLRKNLKATQSAYYMAEIIEKRLPDDEPHEQIFNLFSECLSELDDNDQTIHPLILPFFEINFLSDTGFEPELYECLACGEKITPEGNFFSVENGG
ncbi:TPA: DNA repair protein RecO, partial [Candidatus Berkelbacteria bacterium]|nr:DNA repair protein RecO [Candidatus Berkelbacteria bacterium]